MEIVLVLVVVLPPSPAIPVARASAVVPPWKTSLAARATPVEVSTATFMARAMELEEGFLHQVVGARGVAADRAQVAAHLGGERGVERVEGLDAAGLVRHHLRLEIRVASGRGAHPEGGL